MLRTSLSVTACRPETAHPLQISSAGTLEHLNRYLPFLLTACLLLAPRHADAGVTASHGGYVGSAACRECHTDIFNTVMASSHHKYTRPADTATVIGDFSDRNTLDVKGSTTTMSARDGMFFINTLGPDGKKHDYRCETVIGFNYKQRYTTTLADGRQYVLPVQWNKNEKRWVDYHGLKKARPGSGSYWSDPERAIAVRCAGCHGTGVTLVPSPAAGRPKISEREHSIGCEACHGPGEEHVKNPEEKPVQYTLKTLSARRRTDVCGRCHTRGKDPDTATSYPYGFLPGQRLLTSFAFVEPDIGRLTSAFWPDGRSKKHHQQYIDFVSGAHFTRAGMTCMNCHDQHSGKLKNSDANALCSSCHTSLQAPGALAAHTRHKPDSDGSRCAGCHMPKIVSNEQPLQLRHHGPGIPNPLKTVKWGTPNACSLCHSDEKKGETPQKMADSMREWGIELLPVGVREDRRISP